MDRVKDRLKKYVRRSIALLLAGLLAGSSVQTVSAEEKDMPDRCVINVDSSECIAHWDMNEGEGLEILDQSGRYAGTIRGQVEWVDGIEGKALSFNGGYVELGIPDVEGEWTTSFWVRKGKNTHTNSVLLGGTSAELKLEQYNKTKKLGITMVGKKDYTFEYTLPEGEWCHLAFVGGVSETRLYVNGENVGSIPVSITGPAGRLGAAMSSDLTSKGNMRADLDEVRIYYKALSAEEIEDVYKENAVSYTKDELTDLLKKAEKFSADNYTPKSWDKLEQAVLKAEQIVSSGGSETSEISQVYAELKSAIDSLVELVGENEINIGTFNIAAGRKPDIEAIRTVMEEKQIEAAGIQEVDMFTSRNNYDMLQSFLDGGYYTSAYFQKSIDYGGGEYGIGTVSVYPFSDTGGEALPGTEGIEGRSYSRVQFEKNGYEVALYNTHLSFERYESRSEQIQAILEVMDADPTPYKILTGDFNTNVSKSEFDPFLENYNIANGKDGVWFETVINEDPDNTDSLCIDNIITTRNIKVKNVEMYESGLSDHNLLYAECEFLDSEQMPIQPDPEELRSEYEYYDALSDEFNGNISDMWLMDYMPWWSDTAEREQSGTKTRYRFIDADGEENQSLQIYVNGNNVMGSENFQPYYLEKLSGPSNLEPAERYLAASSQKNSLNSKFAGFMGGSKDYLNTYRGQNAPIENHAVYNDSGATTYGYFETRVKFMPIKRGQGIAPAFWFIGMQDQADELGEVDVFEILDNHTLDFTIHPKGDPDIKKVTKRITFEEDLSQDYHTYGILWDDTGFSLYVDGEFIYKHDQKIDYRMIPIFSINHHENGWIGSVDNQNLPEERTMDIDYYRVFKKNGTDPEADTKVLREMKEGDNISQAAYISLFGLSGTEAEKTPMQWLNDQNIDNMVLSGLEDRVGNSIEASVLPQYLNIEWKTPGKFNTIILHAQNALSTAPTLVDVEISDDGKEWHPVLQDVHLEWQTDSQIAESQKIMLPETLTDNMHTRIVIREANMKTGQFGLCEVEIGNNIEAMTPDYLPLPDTVLDVEGIRNSEFAVWKMDDSLISAKGMEITAEEGEVSYIDSVADNGKALVVDGNTQVLKAPLKNDTEQLKSDEDFTLSMWIKPDYVSKKNGNSRDQIILAQQTGTNGGRPWMFLYEGTLGTYIGGVNTFGKLEVQEEKWQHTAVTFKVIDQEKKQAEVTLYVNGKADTSAVVTYEDDSLANSELLIGRHKNMVKGQYKGTMDEITLLKKALTSEEIAALYEAGGSVEQISNKIYDATSVIKLPVISGKAGEIQPEELNFTDTITVVFDDTYVEDIPVIWNQDEISKINLGKAGTYSVHGSLDMSGYQNITNTQNLYAVQEVEIEEQVNLESLKVVLDRVNAVERGEYTEESFEQFIAACESVQTQETMLIIGKYPEFSVPEIVPEYATQQLVDRIVSDIESAFDLLRKKSEQMELSTTVLEYALALAEDADIQAVLDSVAESFNAAKAEAKSILERVHSGDVSVTQSMVDESWQKLIRLMQYLSFDKGDKSDLEKVIIAAEAIDLEKYLSAGQDVFNEAFELAKGVYKNGDAMQDEVDQSWRALLKAMSELRMKPDKNALKDLISQAGAIGMENCTEELTEKFNAAVAAAKAVCESEEASAEEVDMAADNLRAAIEEIATAVKDPDDGSATAGERSEKDVTPEVTDVLESGNNAVKTLSADKRAVKTGDDLNLTVDAMTAIFAVLLGTAVVRKKKNRR